MATDKVNARHDGPHWKDMPGDMAVETHGKPHPSTGEPRLSASTRGPACQQGIGLPSFDNADDPEPLEVRVARATGYLQACIASSGSDNNYNPSRDHTLAHYQAILCLLEGRPVPMPGEDC